MYVRRHIRFRLLFEESWRFLLVVALWSALVVYIHDFLSFGLISIPIIPLSTIGIAVSLYLGFRSKESYERWWEGRKIWGDIISKSRSFSNQINTLIYDTNGQSIDKDKKRTFIYRHLAWLYALKKQLHTTSRFKKNKKNRLFQHQMEINKEICNLKKYLTKEESESILTMSNPATQILIKQGEALKELVKDGYLDSARHTDISKTISFFYDTQGNCERIKNTPYPRPFAYMGQVFTSIFILLLPLGFLDAFEDEGERYNVVLHDYYMFSIIPFTMLLSWIFFMMEKVSDSMEDPFEKAPNDLPINAMVRTIEIDLKETLGDKDIPSPIKPINDILH